MPAISYQIEEAILAASRNEWRKTAFIVATVERELKQKGIHVTLEAVAETLKQLVQKGQLESQGNLEKWRRSEVRLP